MFGYTSLRSVKNVVYLNFLTKNSKIYINSKLFMWFMELKLIFKSIQKASKFNWREAWKEVEKERSKERS